MITFALIIATFAIAYGLGSIPFGIIITRMAGLGDIRKVGSGNIGATNVMRTGHKMLGISTLLLDAGKGMAAVLVVRFIYPEFIHMAALFAVLGHIFPVWLRFKGGKGVATALGVLFAVNPLIAATACAVWLGVFAYSKTSSVGSLAAIWSTPIATMVLDNDQSMLLCMSLALLITFTHRTNIERLLAGSETAFGRKRA